jgi:hypothetical protein
MGAPSALPPSGVALPPLLPLLPLLPPLLLLLELELGPLSEPWPMSLASVLSEASGPPVGEALDPPPQPAAIRDSSAPIWISLDVASIASTLPRFSPRAL